jgi:hypothetical protein
LTGVAHGNTRTVRTFLGTGTELPVVALSVVLAVYTEVRRLLLDTGLSRRTGIAAPHTLAILADLIAVARVTVVSAVVIGNTFHASV